MGYVLALDIGVASVGWAVIDSESENVLEAGANLFPEASVASNVDRRNMRQIRRLHRRQRTRLDDFKKIWKEYSGAEGECSSTNIVELKVKGLKEEISKEDLFVVLYSYLKHRGISYLEDADESATGTSEYALGLRKNQNELINKYPCQIQYERYIEYGGYRGNIETFNEEGEKICLSNVYTVSAYREEIINLLETQKKYHSFINDDFISDYIIIFNRKRKYYEGPGNENSRTDYGIYSTKVDENTGEYITEANIFEKLIGKCSIYPEEFRAAAASYTAQEYNVLNDLNNLTVNGRKLEENEKREIVGLMLTSKTVNVRNLIKKVMGEDIESLSGARVDKDEKEIFHKFETYRAMRNKLNEINCDIESFTREELDEIGYILTINTEKESMLEAFEKSPVINCSNEVIECLVSFRKKNGKHFSKWNSFSLKIMNELIPEMYEQPKEQMTLLTEMGAFKTDSETFEGVKYIPVEAASDSIYNPVVRRAVRISFKIVNAIIKKYGDLDQIVVEMPRDRNSDEEKKRINDAQKKNEKEFKQIEKELKDNYEITISDEDYSKQKNLKLKLKLWKEQGGKCVYSQKTIEPKDIIENHEKFEIDHIIPRSISFDDSRSNKVLVYRDENQKKGNNTPYYYFMSVGGKEAYDNYKCFINTRTGLSRKKRMNLLFKEDITKIEVLKGFINRNLNDTRYASRVVLNTLTSFFKVKECSTKVKVIRGSFTHQMRINMKLDKNRDENYSHHAVDAMLIAYSQLGYEAYRKLQNSFIDFETGEILDERMWQENMTDDVYKDYLYGQKWFSIRTNIVKAEKEVKYWYYVDRKCNRGLCNQTIYGTRYYNGKTYKINSFDIRSDAGVKKFKELAFDDKKRERLLVYRNNRKTFDNLVSIFEQYSDEKNPFVAYEEETGDVVRKYAKKHNGPRIGKLKYIDGEVGSCIDISHKYGYKKNSRKVILESLVPYRMDVYYNHKDERYYLVGIKQSDVICQNGKYVIDEEAYAIALRNEKMIDEGQTRSDLDGLGYEFLFSFYKNEYIEYEKNGNIYIERFLSRTKPNQRNYIETKPIDKSSFEKQNQVGLSKTTSIKKIKSDVLGNWYLCKKETFCKECDI